MRDFKRALAGLGAGTRKQMAFLRDAPMIAEVERLLDAPGGSWSAKFEARCDEVSKSMFGVTKAEVEPSEPHPDAFSRDASHYAGFSRSGGFTSYCKAVEGWRNWQALILNAEAEIEEVGQARYWRQRQFEITDEVGEELRCFPFFSRQMLVAHEALLPSARISLTGTAKLAPLSVDDWQARLMSDAAAWASRSRA